MELSGITYSGPKIDDDEVFQDLPTPLQRVLETINGFIQFGGALHVRGACHAPSWHSLRHAWRSENAFHRFYSDVGANWVPFAQDCVGDQFFLADGKVIRLLAETGELDALDLGLIDFFDRVASSPVEFLGAQPLLQLENEGNRLQPGQLISVYPPFCTKEAKDGVSLKAVASCEVQAFLTKLPSQLPNEGEKIRVDVTDE